MQFILKVYFPDCLRRSVGEDSPVKINQKRRNLIKMLQEPSRTLSVFGRNSILSEKFSGIKKEFKTDLILLLYRGNISRELRVLLQFPRNKLLPLRLPNTEEYFRMLYSVQCTENPLWKPRFQPKISTAPQHFGILSYC